MNIPSRNAGRDALAISVWENEGGALAHTLDHRYRENKILATQSSIPRRAFTGVEAPAGGGTKIALGRSGTNDNLLLLSKYHDRRGKNRSGQTSSASIPLEAGCHQ